MVVVGMKKRFLAFSLNLIKKYNPDLNEIKLDEIRYGLEGFYLSITKAVVILSISICLGIIKESLLLLLFYNILRETAFGLHASKSWMCWVSSMIIFILLPFAFREVIISLEIKLLLSLLAIILIAMYAPADTKKAPIIYKKKRTKYKMISIINCLLLIIVALLVNNEISTYILVGIYIEVILILPVTYKMFKLPYRNYLSYVPSYMKN